jgi:hypothetical protein
VMGWSGGGEMMSKNDKAETFIGKVYHYIFYKSYQKFYHLFRSPFLTTQKHSVNLMNRLLLSL